MPLVDERARLISNREVGPRLHIMELEAPCISGLLQPGQFVHMALNGLPDHILRRPFSVYRNEARTGVISILYQVVGEGTAYLAGVESSSGASFDLLGPVGTTWTSQAGPKREDIRRALLVGGGVGAAPLFILAEELANQGTAIDVVLGAQKREALATLDDYTALLGREPYCATDDGSFGRAGFCTSLSAELLEEATENDAYDYVAVCGPPVLMKLVANQACDHGVPCEVSLERYMACGVGACLSCVADTVKGKKRVCVDGPIFDAREVIW